MNLSEHKKNARRIERAYEMRQFFVRLRGYCLVLLLLGLSLGVGAFWMSETGQDLDRWALRQFFGLRGAITPPAELVVVGIDNQMLQEHGLPLPRGVIADGLEKIAAAGPRFLIVDAVFDSATFADEEGANERIAAALSLIPSSVKAEGDYSIVTAEGSSSSLVNRTIQDSALFEIPMLVRRTSGRIEYITVSHSDEATPAEKIPLAPVIFHLFGPAGIPEPHDRINFYGPAGTIKSVILQELIDNDLEYAQEKLQGKIVFLGSYSERKGAERMNSDEFIISASSKPMYGVEIHAHVTGNIMEQSWIRQFDYAFQAAIVIIGSLLVFLAVFFLSPVRAGIVIGSLLLVLSVANYLLFLFSRIWTGGVVTLWLVAALSIILAAFWAEYSLRRTEKRIERYGGKEL